MCRLLRMFPCRCFYVLAIVPVICLVISALLYSLRNPPLEPPPSHVPSTKYGDILHVLANRTVQLENIADTSQKRYKTLQDSLEDHNWDDWIPEELKKLLIRLYAVSFSLSEAQQEMEAWTTEWKDFKEAATEVTDEVQKVFDKTSPPKYRLITWVLDYIRASGFFWTPKDVEQYDALCDFAAMAVEHIDILSNRNAHMTEMFEHLYHSFYKMHITAYRIANTTGNIHWREMRIERNPHSCLARNKSMLECGTQAQRDTLLLISNDLDDSVAEIRSDFLYTRYMSKQLERQCDTFQWFQQARSCMMPKKCAVRSQGYPDSITLPPREVFRQFRRYIDKLLQRLSLEE